MASTEPRGMNETKLSVRHRISEAGQVKAELSLKVQIPVCAAVADQLVLLLAKNNSRRLGRIEEILEPRRTDRDCERVIEVSINRVMPLCEQRIFQRGHQAERDGHHQQVQLCGGPQEPDDQERNLDGLLRKLK